MSNVSVAEVIQITAEVFGVSVDDMRKSYRGRHKVKPLGLAARNAAAFVCWRHTDALLMDVARSLGRSSSRASYRLRDAILKFSVEYPYDLDALEKISAIEHRVDEIHELRVEAAELARAHGLGGLTPKQPKHPPSKRKPSRARTQHANQQA